ncbi:hypothetical protein DY000_02026842 [Brassica cretica]|uniref:Uncharacterized protein n=1 Tax=Brassica cretica TaxID=69181 RepID=A0ABQ7E4P6_BRACR|nr:hypothetical protein DY000_02026842 [Brassica cretica]
MNSVSSQSLPSVSSSLQEAFMSTRKPSKLSFGTPPVKKDIEQSRVHTTEEQ